MTDLDFFLGTHSVNWLWEVEDVPLFVSYRRLKRRKTTFPRATTRWALDSGGFTELFNPPAGSPQTVWHDCPNNLGIPEVRWPHRWQVTPEEYVEQVRRFARELGGMEWAAPQDWMCEPWIIRDTGLSVEEHQRRTIWNGMLVRKLAPELPWVWVAQGWGIKDYHRHVDMHAEAGIDLTQEPLVGVGSVCRRESTAEAEAIFETLAQRGLRLHGFGVKTKGLALYERHLVSSDSLSWSFRARKIAQERRRGINNDPPPSCGKPTCANCLHFALEWRERVLAELERASATHQFNWFDLEEIA